MISRALVEALRQSGHLADLWTTPTNRFGRQFASYLSTRLMDVELTGTGEKIDRLISLRFPSYLLKHPAHVCWLNHRMREYYDLWPNWSSRLNLKGKIKEQIRRQLIHWADKNALTKNVKRVFAQSTNVQKQLLRWGNIPSEVLYPPPGNGYYTEKYGDFILSPARLTPLKRVPLLLEALKVAKCGRVVLAGDGPEQQEILQWVHEHGMEQQVECLGYVQEQDLKRLYAECKAVYYAPVNEDFGLVTLEAFRSKKPVITTHDSGGPAELVEDGITGFVVQPDPHQIAASIQTLFEDSSIAQRFGSAADEKWKHINWPDTVRRLCL